ncbi:uncharacterized protein CANTADRAFT_27361 [Suhomyces tanzawaensis NRRL Y-17324]|uniref:NUDE domain-containing protein n=1 Tax=Suhomyces tanzawaensis NRRL Y-17324 TaxID=984487 RepID=A0A1E4SDV0_9ASCO|nr:uncharacterized protein CANTADRAFT_27361 [Suhomyces tanzawaensis NRRL Y-17324]ODV77648.1 hypothetical protein CANTADRAFT_27361 [Suhomyces tanzawaensis NRRL Y-17324]
MDSPTPVREVDVPLTPTRYSRNVLRDLSKDELVEKVLELESVLNEFQESSKELEQALEEELQGLEAANVHIQKALDAKLLELEETKAKIVAMNQELNALHDSHNDRIRESEEKVTLLKQQLVSVEIANDSMESNDRMLSHKLELANQFNNELLEKMAILENDYERERKAGMEKQLYITNYQNEVKELNSKIESLEHRSDSPDADALFISMREVLSAGPPSTSDNYGQPQMRKSSSLKKLQDMTNEVQSFIRNSTTTGLKSPSTTTTTNQHAVAITDIISPSKSIKSSKGKITPSPSSTNLHNEISRLSSYKSTSSVFSRDSKKSDISTLDVKSQTSKNRPRIISKELSPIKGSPNPERMIELDEKPKSKLKLFGR